VTPVRYACTNRLTTLNERADLFFSAAGGDATNYIANNENAYPLHVTLECPQDVSSIDIASVPEVGRNIKNWKLYRSYDPAAMNDAAHASWALVTSGVGDATIAVP
jgi:hypothetical protein